VRIAILGTRGIPARYGGFETLAEELSARLAARGHEITVYTRTRYAEPGLAQWRGARIRVLPTIASKYLDTVVHGALSALDSVLERFDAVLVCNAINAAVSFLPRLSGRTRVVLNVDGLERHRRKWSAAGRAAYLVSERLSTIVPDAVVSDAPGIAAD
jgi:glycosyltransferase involved in cell wall biosynthesis